MLVSATHIASSPSAKADKVLHVFPSFGIGGVPLRTVRVINSLKGIFSHQIISLDNNFEAAAQFSPEANVTLLELQHKNHGTLSSVLNSWVMLRQLRPRLLFTYNWGAIEWAIANRLSVISRHVHFEAGFGKEEADNQIMRRVLCRRWALASCIRVVVASRRLEDLARRVWGLPAEIVSHVPEGVDVERFTAPARDAIPGFVRRPGELVVGTVAPLRPEKNIERLLRAFAVITSTTKPLRLIIAGDGSERAKLEKIANELGIAGEVLFTGQVKPEAVLGTFDVFALSSDTEQMPIALLEAMAAGRAIAAVDVGDVKGMVCDDNKRFIVPRDDHAKFSESMRELLNDHWVREMIGMGNHTRVAAEFSQERMFRAYHRLFEAG
jgi:glycosyltransferase involved in cell wall biosynthesis